MCVADRLQEKRETEKTTARLKLLQLENEEATPDGKRKLVIDMVIVQMASM